MNYDLITILGPTASGKTPLAASLAARMGTEIISGDSRQIYRRMDLGTGKDLADYVVDGHPVPYHLIDIAEPGYKYNVFEFQRDFLSAYEDMRKRGLLPILCGGTGMYIESVLKGYKLLPVPENPELRTKLADKSLKELTDILATYKKLHNSTDVDTVKRAIRAIEIEEYYLHQNVEERAFPEIHSLIIGVDIDRELRREKISRRLKQRLDEGMIEEVRALLESGIAPEDLIYYGLEYKYLTLYVTGELTYEEKHLYTAVCRGNLHLAHARFLHGCTGLNLDILCREPMWKLGLDFKHGTGHGVGYILNVHEGPNAFRWKQSPSLSNAVLEPGMVTTDEPGLYLTGKFGIRLENELVCKKLTDNEYGTFLGFEILTMIPFDLDAVLPEEMSEEERQWLNEYHQKVYETVAESLPEKERIWLREATRQI